MKKILFTTAIAVSAFCSSFVYAIGLNSQCADGKFSIDINLSQGESCTAEQNLTVNGESTTTNFDVSMDETIEISLDPGDEASVSLTLQCSTGSGSSSNVSTSQSTSNGCQGSTEPFDFDDFPPFGDFPFFPFDFSQSRF